MLVLTRKRDQSVVINGNIRVTVVGVKSNGDIKLGFEAPEGISVNREEIERAIRAGQKPAR